MMINAEQCHSIIIISRVQKCIISYFLLWFLNTHGQLCCGKKDERSCTSITSPPKIFTDRKTIMLYVESICVTLCLSAVFCGYCELSSNYTINMNRLLQLMIFDERQMLWAAIDNLRLHRLSIDCYHQPSLINCFVTDNSK